MTGYTIVVLALCAVATIWSWQSYYYFNVMVEYRLVPASILPIVLGNSHLEGTAVTMLF